MPYSISHGTGADVTVVHGLDAAEAVAKAEQLRAAAYPNIRILDEHGQPVLLGMLEKRLQPGD